MLELIPNLLAVDPASVESMRLDDRNGSLTITMKSGETHTIESKYDGYPSEQVSAHGVYRLLKEACRDV